MSWPVRLPPPPSWWRAQMQWVLDIYRRALPWHNRVANVAPPFLDGDVDSGEQTTLPCDL